MQAAYLYKDQIKDDIISLSQLKKQKGSERNILNKWFQDSIKNYFLETYASPFLKNELGEGLVKKVKTNIERRMAGDGLKFMNLLNQYKAELEYYGKAPKFVNSLISIVIDDQKLEHGSVLWGKQAKKKFVALMLIVLMEYSEGRVNSFYDMWNYIFPAETQIKKKLSREDKLRLKAYNAFNFCGSSLQTTTTLTATPSVAPVSAAIATTAGKCQSPSTRVQSFGLTNSNIASCSSINSSTTLGYNQFQQTQLPTIQQNRSFNRENPQALDSFSQCSRTSELQEPVAEFLQYQQIPFQHSQTQQQSQQQQQSQPYLNQRSISYEQNQPNYTTDAYTTYQQQQQSQQQLEQYQTCQQQQQPQQQQQQQQQIIFSHSYNQPNSQQPHKQPQQQQQQQQSQPTQPSQQYFIQTQPFIIQANTYTTQTPSYTYNSEFLSTPEIYRRINSAGPAAIPLKAESYEHQQPYQQQQQQVVQEGVNFEEQQQQQQQQPFFIDRQSEEITSHQISVTSHSQNSHLISNIHHQQPFHNQQQQQQQPQQQQQHIQQLPQTHQTPYVYAESMTNVPNGTVSMHLSQKATSRAVQSTITLPQTGCIYPNNLDMHNYFGVDTFFSQNCHPAGSTAQNTGLF